MATHDSYDVAVIGAGVFGSWTAWHFAKRGKRVCILDAYGPGDSRASSGGETRIIRMGYGADEIYTRWSQRSLMLWKEFFAATRQPLFHRTGVLWLAAKGDERIRATAETLTRCGVAFEEMDRGALEKRYPQISFEHVHTGLLEPHSGVLMARRSVAAVLEDAIHMGADYRVARVATPKGSGELAEVATESGERIRAEQFVFACGSWMGKVFPEILSTRIFPSRQEVFFFGVPAGDSRFAASQLPTWLFQADEMYGMPDIEHRGLKIAVDHHGPRVDPDTQSRVASAEGVEEARQYVARRFPALRDAPIVETRVCQYENTSSGDFLVDRHPKMENIRFVGGGSGHGFKHGPALGEYVVSQILDAAKAEERFSLASKKAVQQRAIF